MTPYSRISLYPYFRISLFPYFRISLFPYFRISSYFSGLTLKFHSTNQKIMNTSNHNSGITRRTAIQSVLGAAGAGMMMPQPAEAANLDHMQDKTKVKITKLETFLIKPRW